MTSAGLPKKDRQEKLREWLGAHPFSSDEELARVFGVSVQTIRLDRMALGIPELRERTKSMAARSYGLVRSLGAREIIGQLIDLELGKKGISMLETTQEMVFERTRVVRGQHLYAQAESLAIAVCDAEVALVGLVNVKFKRPVQLGEKLISKAQVLHRRGNRLTVLVESFIGQDKVFRAKFLVFALEPAGGGLDDSSRS